MGTDQAARGPRPTSVVLFVYDLDESAAFYGDLLRMEVQVRTETAALLVGADWMQVYLRTVGEHAAHIAGDIGVQYVIWTAADHEDLHRCERLLKERSRHVSTWETEGLRVVEGRDPSGSPVLFSYPGPDKLARHEIMNRIYAW